MVARGCFFGGCDMKDTGVGPVKVLGAESSWKREHLGVTVRLAFGGIYCWGGAYSRECLCVMAVNSANAHSGTLSTRHCT